MTKPAQKGVVISSRKQSSPHALHGTKQNPYLYFLDILNVLKHLVFPVIMSILGLIAFCFAAPGKDMMRILGSDTQFILQWPAAVFTIWWSTTLWYGSRVLLHHCQIEYINKEFSTKVQKWSPRLIGMLAFMDLMIGLIAANKKFLSPIVITYIILGALTLVFLIRRRAWFKNHFSIEGFDAAPVEFRPRTFFKDWPYFTISLLLFLVFFIIIIISPVRFTRAINPTGIILTAFAGWSMLGLLIKVFDKVFYLPVLTIIFLLSFLFGKLNFNNIVPGGQEKNGVKTSNYFDAWYGTKAWKDSAQGKKTVFIITAEGGASRSAYWTGKTLAHLQEENNNFYDHIFALTSVSGGSLGVSSFFVLMESLNHENHAKFDKTELNEKATQMLSRDFLSPVSSGMLYPNLLQQFLPFRLKFGNRANYLEKGWTHEWEKVSALDFTQPFTSYWKNPKTPPLLVLNTTHVESGKRGVISYASFDTSICDLFDIMHDVSTDANFTLQKAVSSSAAFPYISPSARIRARDGTWGNLVDGGYFENSGVYTAIDIYNNIKSSIHFNDVEIYFIVIRAFPDKNAYKPSLWLNETADPLKAIFDTRGARSPHSYILLENMVGKDRIFKIQLDDHDEVPVNWYISKEGRARMDSLFKAPENEETMQKIRKKL